MSGRFLRGDGLIDGRRDACPIPALCAMLGVSPSGRQAWKSGGTANWKLLSDPQMLTLIRAIHVELNFQARRTAYGMISLMSRKGHSRENAPTERIFNSFKNQRVRGTRCRSDDERSLVSSTTSRRSAIGSANIPPWPMPRHKTSRQTGLEATMNTNWRHNAGWVDNEKPVEA